MAQGFITQEDLDEGGAQYGKAQLIQMCADKREEVLRLGTMNGLSVGMEVARWSHPSGITEMCVVHGDEQAHPNTIRTPILGLGRHAGTHS